MSYARMRSKTIKMVCSVFCGTGIEIRGEKQNIVEDLYLAVLMIGRSHLRSRIDDTQESSSTLASIVASMGNHCKRDLVYGDVTGMSVLQTRPIHDVSGVLWDLVQAVSTMSEREEVEHLPAFLEMQQSCMMNMWLKVDEARAWPWGGREKYDDARQRSMRWTNTEMHHDDDAGFYVFRDVNVMFTWMSSCYRTAGAENANYAGMARTLEACLDNIGRYLLLHDMSSLRLK